MINFARIRVILIQDRAGVMKVGLYEVVDTDLVQVDGTPRIIGGGCVFSQTQNDSLVLVINSIPFGSRSVAQLQPPLMWHTDTVSVHGSCRSTRTALVCVGLDEGNGRVDVKKFVWIVLSIITVPGIRVEVMDKSLPLGTSWLVLFIIGGCS